MPQHPHLVREVGKWEAAGQRLRNLAYAVKECCRTPPCRVRELTASAFLSGFYIMLIISLLIVLRLGKKGKVSLLNPELYFAGNF